MFKSMFKSRKMFKSKKLLNSKKFGFIFATTLILVLALSACGQDTGGGGADAAAETGGGGAAPAADVEVGGAIPEGREQPPEGANTNNGRPFNLTPIAWDSRNVDRYLNGINATILPIVENEGDLVIEIWFPFSSTIMSSMDESEVFQEAQRRTNVVLDFAHPPVGSETDNFMLRIAADDLPHIFWTPPEYPGGPVQAVTDQVYLDLTPYYNAGFMPNIHWLRNYHPIADEINRGFTDDLGRMLAVIMIDIVPTSPWSGLWMRQDWLDDFGFDVPETISEWDTILRTWRDHTGTHVLGINLDLWFGEETNYGFTAAFDSAFRNFLNVDGTVTHGSIQPGYRDFLALMNSWFADGILDPDFATLTYDDFVSRAATGQHIAFGMAYGSLGQMKMTGMHLEPRWQIVPTLNPSRDASHTTRLGQNNSAVREARAFATYRVADEGLQEPILRWMDYWYSQDGGDLASYGIEGHSFQWRDDGTFEFIHPTLDEPGADFWTLFGRFKMHEWIYLRDSSAYDNEPEVWECIELWGSQDHSWLMPDNRMPTPEEARDMAGIMPDVNTHILEQTLAFIIGARPLDQFDDFVAELEGMGIHRAIEIEQEAVTRYLNR